MVTPFTNPNQLPRGARMVPVFMPQPGAQFNSSYARAFTRNMANAAMRHGYARPNSNAAGAHHVGFVPSYKDMLHATIAANSAQRFAGSQMPVQPTPHAPQTMHMPSPPRNTTHFGG